jgi:hypothetical protein
MSKSTKVSIVNVVKRNVPLTLEQRRAMPHRLLGLTSGKKNKETGERLDIWFCDSLAFFKVFGYENTGETVII